MAIESASFITQLDATNPKGSDQRSTLDNHARITKKAVKQSLPNLNSTASMSSGELNHLVGLTANAQAQINGAISAIAVTSANLSTQIEAISNSLVSLSGTVAHAIRWDGSIKYQQTATPALSNGDIWFEPE